MKKVILSANSSSVAEVFFKENFGTNSESYSDSDEISGHQRIILKLTPNVCGMRLDKVISILIPQYSRNRIQHWIESEGVIVDGRFSTKKTIVYGDETVVVLLKPAPEEQSFKAEYIPLKVVYEDQEIIIINKPAGLVVHPAPGNWSKTLLNGLLFRYPMLTRVPRAGIVHRLDKDTSGLMVVAKTLEAQTNLVRQMQARTVKRQYLALVWGIPDIHGTIDNAIARHQFNRHKMAVSYGENAKTAITYYQRLEIGLLCSQPVSLMKCWLKTGRTHQIRVHMHTLGFSLIGDTLYGKPHAAPVFPRQALQASHLGLIHPHSHEACEWSAPLPEDFIELLSNADINVPEVDFY